MLFKSLKQFIITVRWIERNLLNPTAWPLRLATLLGSWLIRTRLMDNWKY